MCGTILAGGTKYEVGGIIFKLATNRHGLYADDEGAMRQAGAELIGVAALTPFHAIGLCVPLICNIDYRGFRLNCVARLPVSRHTLLSGSDDGGDHVCTSAEFDAKLDDVSRTLNLQQHVVTDAAGARHCIHGPFDMEGHRGTDGRLYLLDFVRLAPPEPPPSGCPVALEYDATHSIFFSGPIF